MFVSMFSGEIAVVSLPEVDSSNSSTSHHSEEKEGFGFPDESLFHQTSDDEGIDEPITKDIEKLAYL